MRTVVEVEAKRVISVEEAQTKILTAVSVQPTVTLSLFKAVGRTLVQALQAPFDSPPFDNAAMDGYALRADDTTEASQDTPVWLRQTQSIPAGIQPKQALASGETARIFTGAMLPPGATAVVKQEDVMGQGNQIALRGKIVTGDNIRRRGEEVKAGDVLLSAGATLSPAGIGFIAGFGLEKIMVYEAPRVGVITTGSELMDHNTSPQAAKIFDSNSFSLIAALAEMNVPIVYQNRASDQKESLQKTIAAGLEEADFLLVTGGVSVGDYDFVREVAKEVGIEPIFWQVAQRPGKPLFFGRRADGKLLFGLPGNPASVLVCFYEYVRPGLRKAMGATAPFLPTLTASLAGPFRKKAGQVHFLRSFLSSTTNPPTLKILGKQGSHMMGSFAAANCLAMIPAEITALEAGSAIEAHLLPHFFSLSEDKA